jgi:hypothetical protein
LFVVPEGIMATAGTGSSPSKWMIFSSGSTVSGRRWNLSNLIFRRDDLGDDNWQKTV